MKDKRILSPATETEVFGQALKEHRLKRGFSQEQLGLESGYHRTYISQLERGLKSPSLTTIIHLAQILDTTASAMLQFVEVRIAKIRESEERSANE